MWYLQRRFKTSDIILEMANASNGNAKPTLCRYFVKGGSCFYGDECQFVHGNSLNSSSNQEAASSDSVMSVSAEEPLDMYSSYQHAHMNGLPSESKLHTFLSRSITSTTPSAAVNNTDFLSPNPNNSFSAMSLESQNNANLSSTSQEYYTPSAVGLGGATLTQSVSSPSFLSSGSTPGGNSSFGRFRAASPGCSPRLSPSHSPLLQRRNKSPLSHIPTTESSSEDSTQQALYQENVGGTTYYYTHDNSVSSGANGAGTVVSTNDESCVPPIVSNTGVTSNNDSVLNDLVMPDFHVYPSIPAHVEHMQPKPNAPSYFMPDELRLDILHRQRLTMARADSKLYPELPSEVDQYHNLCPLESVSTNNQFSKSATFGYVTSVYKAANMKTGISYCLRRIHGFRLVSTKCMNIVDMWKNVQHSNIVQLREVFTTKAFGGEHSIVFVHDYHPNATTLMAHYFGSPLSNGYSRASVYGPEGAPRPFSQSKQHLGSRQPGGLMPEGQIWAYVVQLSSVLRAIHAAGLACRTLDPTKILVTSKSRLRVNCCGIFDILTYDHSQPDPLAHIQHFQQEDLLALGKIILALATNSVTSVTRENMQKAIELVTRRYSNDLRNLILYLLSTQIRVKSVNDIMPMIGARFYTQLDAAQMRSDVIENELAKEVDNGRLFRLITKLSMITERPEFNLDHTWSETGDRYMLKLFRDYVFHMVNEDGIPWLDVAHVLQCLNKLDAGVEEKVCLTSRDEQNVLVVTYADLKNCYDTAFSELVNSAAGRTSKPS